MLNKFACCILHLFWKYRVPIFQQDKSISQALTYAAFVLPAGQFYFTSANLRDSCPSGKSGSRCFAEDGETVPDLSGIRYGWR
ncbi:hypothetical protein F0365_09620 [Nonlabens sp. Ci31]|uniref:hypothetical protein n=1 Tax=Nonlabens sp. Ci31 TaxID=2608253 RepID=UPI00146421DE|nr:hypothetical protein [Nonlabens sp. Ci31]QJP34631.1 hypothetical protein F0365_09620 [Nonlabens sp. Ci31]